MNQIELLKKGKELLKKQNIEETEIKAKKILEFVLKQSREEFIVNELSKVSKVQEQKYMEKLTKIIQGEPLQYITNLQEFMGLDFYVDENVLIPQPDTEILVEQVIIYINSIIQNDEICKTETNRTIEPIRILDLCTGSGAIAISISKYCKKQIKNTSNNKEQCANNSIQIVASDVSRKALKIAKKNAIKNQVDKNIEFIESDMFSKLEDVTFTKDSNEKMQVDSKMFDVIVSNPPYIESSVIPTLSPEVQKEPNIALDGGEDGLKFYRIILEQVHNYLKSNGYVLLEIGYNQGKKIIDLWKKLKDENKCELTLVTNPPIKDLAGNDRVMIFKKVSKE